MKVLQGFGNFVQTPPFAPFVYDLIRDSDQVHNYLILNCIVYFILEISKKSYLI